MNPIFKFALHLGQTVVYTDENRHQVANELMQQYQAKGWVRAYKEIPFSFNLDGLVQIYKTGINLVEGDLIVPHSAMGCVYINGQPMADFVWDDATVARVLALFNQSITGFRCAKDVYDTVHKHIYHKGKSHCEVLESIISIRAPHLQYTEACHQERVKYALELAKLYLMYLTQEHKKDTEDDFILSFDRWLAKHQITLRRNESPHEHDISLYSDKHTSFIQAFLDEFQSPNIPITPIPWKDLK